MCLARFQDEHISGGYSDCYLLDSYLRCSLSNQIDFGDYCMYMRFVDTGVSIADRKWECAIPRSGIPALGAQINAMFQTHAFLRLLEDKRDCERRRRYRLLRARAAYGGLLDGAWGMNGAVTGTASSRICRSGAPRRIAAPPAPAETRAVGSGASRADLG